MGKIPFKHRFLSPCYFPVLWWGTKSLCVSQVTAFVKYLYLLTVLYTFDAIDASSGYFSALDQTDFEDVLPTTTATHSMQTARRVPLIPGSHTGVSPMIIMNNLVLKQVLHMHIMQ